MKTIYYALILIIGSGCITNKNLKTDDNWYYKLQNYNNNDFLQHTNSIIVIDTYRSIAPDIKFSKDYLKNLKNKNNKVYSYFSIGEAEDYRPYYDKKSFPKELIVSENPNWPGNYTIKYWDKRWQNIILQYLDIIIEQGFNGVYLDIIDAFHRFPNKNVSATKMKEFVILISKHAKAKNKNFQIIIQNGIDIVDYLKLEEHKHLLKSIDGIAIEDYLFSNNREKADQSVLKYLKFYQNKTLLSVEYLTNDKNQNEYFEICKKYSLKPLITDKQLKGKYYIFK